MSHPATPLARRRRNWFAPARPTGPVRKARLACTALEARDVPASVSGTVYHDTDVTGTRTNPTLEPGLAGRIVYADLNGNGLFDTPAVAVAAANVPVSTVNDKTVASTVGVGGYAGTLTDVNVTVNIRHPNLGSVQLTLVAPNGTRVALASFNLAGSNLSGTTFDDQASLLPYYGSAPYTGSYRPTQALAAMNGQPVTGTWTLEVSNSATSSADTGTLDAWSLQLATTVTAADPATTTDAGGAFTLAGLPAGVVTVGVAPPPGWVPTAPVADTVTFATAASTVTGRLFGQVEADSVRGSAYQDNNGNGKRDFGEPAQAGRPIQLVAAGGGATAVTTTDANGLFVFAPVAAGGYTVRPAPLAGWATTQPAAGSFSVTTSPGGFVGGVDFGLQGDGLPPAADVVDVTPDPRATPVTAVAVTFSEAVAAVSPAAFTLTRGGATVPLTGATVTPAAGFSTWTLLLPADLTAANGAYSLTLGAGGAVDFSGTANTAAAGDAWAMNDTTAPAVTVYAGPAGQDAPLGSAAFAVSEPVAGFTAGDVSLTLDGGPNLLTAAQPLTASADGLTYTLGNLAAVAGRYGTYTLTLPAGAFTDRAANPLAAGATATWYNAAGVGDETRINTFISYDQTAPAVATDGAGVRFAVWQSAKQDGSGTGVYGAVYAADLTRLTGDDFRVNVTTAGDQAAPAVAANARGDAVVVWQSAGQDGDGLGVYARRYAAGGVPVGGEVRVNVTAAGDQSAPRVAVAADGSFLVVWQSGGQDGDGLGVYARRFGPTGVPLGGEVRVNATTAGDQFEPTVGCDAAGNALVAWTDGGADGSGFGIFARRLSSAGTLAGGEVRVNGTTAGDQTRPRVAVNAAGAAVVAWQDAATNIVTQRYAPGGAAVGGETRVSPPTAASRATPAVAIDPAGGVAVAWQSGGGIYAVRSVAAGEVSPEFRVGTDPYTDKFAPAASLDGNGGLTVVWQHTGDQNYADLPDYASFGIAARSFAPPPDVTGAAVLEVRAADGRPLPAGTRRTAPVAGLTVAFSEPVANAADRTQYRLTRNGLDVSDRVTGVAVALNPVTRRTEATLALAVPLGDGEYVLTAQPSLLDAAGNRLDGAADGGFAEAFTTAFTVAAGGAARGGDVAVNTSAAGGQGSARVGMDAAGNTVVVWQSSAQGGGGTTSVRAQRYAANGAPLGAEFRVDTTTAAYQAAPAVAVAPAGAFVVAWCNETVANGVSTYNVVAQRYDAAGTAVGGEVRVSTWTDGIVYDPAVAIGPTGDFVVAWTSAYNQDGDGSGVYARRFDAGGTAQGGEFLATTTTARNQARPSVAVAATGAFAIAWVSDVGTGNLTGVFAQRFDAAGAKLGSEFRLSAAAPSDQILVTVAYDSAGTLVAAWQTGRSGPSPIYTRRFGPGGSPLGDEAWVGGVGLYPQVAVGAAGDAVVVWEEPDAAASPTTDIAARRYDATGAAVGNVFRVNAVTTGNQDRAAVAVNASGDFMVTWRASTEAGASVVGIGGRRFGRLTAPVTATVGGGGQAAPGGRFGGPVGTVAVTFSGPLSTAGGAAGAASVTNPANWQLSRGGVPVANGIAGVVAAVDAATGRTTATVTFATPLAADGAYAVTALPAILDLTGTPIDGDFDGVGGGAAAVYFGVAAPATAGPDRGMNTDTAGNQDGVAVATGAAGTGVVVWQSATATTGLDVVGRTVSAAGTLGAEFTIGGAGDQQSPDVAADAAGNFVVAYAAPDAGGIGVFARRYTAAGVAVGGPVAVNGTTANDQTVPAVATTAAGDFVVAWASDGQDGDGLGVYARRFRADGTPLGSEFRVNTYTAGDQAAPVVATDAAGNFTVAWQSNGQDGSFYGVYAQRYAASGAPLGGEFRVNEATAGNQLQPAVAADAAGNLVFAWSGSPTQSAGQFDVYARRYSAAGVALGGETLVNTTTALQQSRPSVGVAADGDTLIAWQDIGQDGSGFGVYSRRFGADGTAQTGEVRVNATTAQDQSRPAVALDADGDALVAWASNGQDGSGLGVYARQYRANNLAPLFVAPSPAVPAREDTTTVVRLRDTFLDIEDGAELTYAVVGNTNAALATATVTAGVLTIVPAADANGTATVTVRATDTAGGFVETALVVTVAAVNDAPTVTLTGNPPAVPQGAGAQSVAGFAAFTAGPADEATQTASYSVTANTNATLFGVQPAIMAAGTLTYTPAAGRSGTAVVTVQGKDSGGTANGGVDLAAARTFTITVTAPPRVASTAVNGGGAQRSAVASLVVTFTRAVTFTGFSVAAAFQLTRDGVGLVGGFTATTATVNGTTAVTLGNFTGANTAGGSLADGTYTLAVNGSQVQAADGLLLDGDNNGTPGGNYGTGFHRYLADFDGDTAVDGNDLAVFAGAFNSVEGDSAYRTWLDLDGDGAVDGNDLAIFAQRFNTVL